MLRFGFRHLAFAVVVFACAAGVAAARDAAFLDPGSASGGQAEEALKVEPKAEIDVGETALNMTKRSSVFFSNQSGTAVRVEKVTVNGDANVTGEISANDCLKQGSIEPGSRCSVEVSVTPSSPGSWNVDVLMTHNGAGRITRAKLTGKTGGSSVTETKGSGLALSAKEAKPVDFGDVTIGSGKVVRSALMVNDSAEAITLYSIDVIEADNGLQRLEQGCAVDMELPPGASCPVTLLWMPKNNGPVSTDLIIRHSGKMGFAVVPVRGMAKGGADAVRGDGRQATGESGGSSSRKDVVPLPPSASDLEQAMAGRVAPVSSAALGGDSSSSGSGGDGRLHLIGTIGERALILKPDGQTEIAAMGGEFEVGGKTAKVVAIGPRSAALVVDGVRRELKLEAASSLVEKARADQDAAARSAKSVSGVTKTTTQSGTPRSVSVDAGGK